MVDSLLEPPCVVGKWGYWPYLRLMHQMVMRFALHGIRGRIKGAPG